jgi:antitoxin MazE
LRIFYVDTFAEVVMRIRVQKWGNSLALRIPKSFAAETALGQGAEVDLTLEEGRLVVTPLTHPEYTLESLLSRITPDNIHRETDTGPGVGDEVW